MFERILVCLDGSELAEQILPYAAAQALRFDSRVTLLQVIGPASSIAMASLAGALPQTGEVIEEDAQRQQDESAAYLEGAARSLREEGIEVECVSLGQAQPGEAIVKHAQDGSFDLICIATHGHSGLGRAVFGSVADYVLRESGLPILVIKPQEADE